MNVFWHVLVAAVGGGIAAGWVTSYMQRKYRKDGF